MVLSFAGVLHAGQVLTVADFSRADVGKTPPQYWEALTFKKITVHTIYEVVKDQGQTVIKAQNHAPIETRIPNPYTKRVMMIAVQSGVNKVGTWVTEERNIYQDYVDSFGHSPPMTSGVAIMTDSDNTGEAATAFYGDIILKSSPGATTP